MTAAAAIVYSFAVAPGLPPVVGAPSFGVLARQIPRLIVGSMNAGGDRGLRFFPLLGPMNGRRQFFMIPDLLAPEQLAKIHGQAGEVRFLVDGRIESDGTRVRIHEAQSLREVFDETLPMDPLDPLPTVTRVIYELSGQLEWTGALPQLPQLTQPALSYFLVAKDDLLSLEAGFERDGEGHWLHAVKTIIESGHEEPEVRELLLEICRRLTTDQAATQKIQEVVDLLTSVAARTDETGFLADIATRLQSMGQVAAGAAATVFERLVGRELEDEAIVLRVAAHLFHRGRNHEGRTQLEQALTFGLRTPRVLAQLIVFCQRLGRRQRRDEVVLELIGAPNLPPRVARMLCAELVEMERISDAVAVGQRGVVDHPENAALWLELGRAHMYAGAPDLAAQALDAADSVGVGVGVDETLRAEVERLRRFVDDPGVLRDLAGLDAMLGADDLPGALRLAKGLTKRRPGLAEGWLLLGIVRQRLAQPKLAIDAFRHALEVDSTLGEAYNRSGILRVGLGMYRAGYDELREAARLMPGESGPWIHLAQACSYLDKADEGRAALAKAAQLGASPDTVASVQRAFFPENG